MENMEIRGRLKMVLWLSLAGCILFFWIFGAILSPFILGALMAYGYRPIHGFFQKHHVSDGVAALILALVTYGIFLYIFLNALPVLGTWSHLLSIQFNVYRQAFWDFLTPLMPDVFKESGSPIQESIDMVLRQSIQWVGSLIMMVLHNGWALVHIVITLALSPVIAFHLVKDGVSIRKRFYTLMPCSIRSTVALCLRDVDRALRQYFLGQLQVCMMLAVYYGFFLWIGLNLPHALLLSILSGFLVFIPYVGFFISALSSCMVGVVESGQISYVSTIALVYLGGNILESVVLTPYCVGSRTGLHPLWILFAVLIGGGIKGIVGIVLALPLATIAGAIWRLLRKRYVRSAVYLEKKENLKQQLDPMEDRQ